MRKALMAALLVLMFCAGCAGKATTAKISELEARNEELSKRITKLEEDLSQTKLDLVKHQVAMQTLNDRLKTVEVGVDKLAYGSAAH